VLPDVTAKKLHEASRPAPLQAVALPGRYARSCRRRLSGHSPSEPLRKNLCLLGDTSLRRVLNCALL
jgi:hypothetical protein